MRTTTSRSPPRTTVTATAATWCASRRCAKRRTSCAKRSTRCRVTRTPSARYPQPRSAVMPRPPLAQEELVSLTPGGLPEVATARQLDAGYGEGVATFYTLFPLEPIGKHRFYMCTNLSCTLRGAEEMVE